TEVRTMGVVARRVAGDRQKGDALLRDRHPSLLASQEFELVATLAVGRRGAIVAAAAEKPIFALYAGIDVMGARAGERRREEGGAEGRPQNSSDHIRSSCWRPAKEAIPAAVRFALQNAELPPIVAENGDAARASVFQ